MVATWLLLIANRIISFIWPYIGFQVSDMNIIDLR